MHNPSKNSRDQSELGNREVKKNGQDKASLEFGERKLELAKKRDRLSKEAET